MPQVLIWKCPKTNKLFEDKKKYQRHLKQLARQRLESRRASVEHDKLAQWWSIFQDTEFDIADLPSLIIQNQKYFWAAAQQTDARAWQNLGKIQQGVQFPVPEILEFEAFSLHWSDSVSNSHAAPRTGVTNWGGDRKLPDGTPAPRGYPGWRGRVSWLVRWPVEWAGYYPASDLFRGSLARMHQGTGGGGGQRLNEKYQCSLQSFTYDVSIFAADWPGPARYREKQLMWQVLSQQGEPA